MKVTPGRSSGHPNNELENTISLVFLTELAGYELHELARDNLEDKHEFLHTWGHEVEYFWERLSFRFCEVWTETIYLEDSPGPLEKKKTLNVLFLYEPTEQIINWPCVFWIFVCNLWSFPCRSISRPIPPGNWRFGKFLTTQGPSFQMERTSSLGKIHQNSTSHLWLWEANLFQDDVQEDEFGAVCSLLSLPTCSLLCCCFSCTPQQRTRLHSTWKFEKRQILPTRGCLRWFSFFGV